MDNEQQRKVTFNLLRGKTWSLVIDNMIKNSKLYRMIFGGKSEKSNTDIKTGNKSGRRRKVGYTNIDRSLNDFRWLDDFEIEVSGNLLEREQKMYLRDRVRWATDYTRQETTMKCELAYVNVNSRQKRELNGKVW